MNPLYGYYFYPKAYHHAPGHPRLDIQIPETPTGQHFDPKYVELFVRGAGDQPSLEHLIIEHPWTRQKSYTVCAGRVSLRDRLGKKIHAFTFGGQMHIQVQPTLTLGIIESPAPILDLSAGSDVAVTLVEETEILFAERRALWPDDAEFDARLVQTPPQTLYAVCLEALHTHFSQIPHAHLPQMIQFLTFLHAEIAALQTANLWPARAPSIAEIL